MDAGNGFAQPAWQAAYPALMAKARANGIALLAVRNSRHFAVLWPDVEPLARDGLVARWLWSTAWPAWCPAAAPRRC